MRESDLLPVDIIVAGQICLDVILMFNEDTVDLASLVVPGRCVVVENAAMSTGGSVANTGLALHQLGISVRLIAKIGDDTFGQSLLKILEQSGKGLTENMIVVENEMTSYSIVLDPPGADRSFLYIPGANHSFHSEEVKDPNLKGSRYFHFGYPPEMRLIYSNQGKEFIQLMRRVKKLGLTTSLDMAFPDVNSEAGKVNWKDWLKAVLPFIDIFLPSYHEICFMLDPQRYKRLSEPERSQVDLELVRSLASQVLEMGVAMVVIKLGEQGIYFQSSDDLSRFDKMGAGKPSDPDKWLNRTISVPCFKANVIGTTGTGDCAVAGFLAGISKDLDPTEVLTMAAATGAFSAEHVDASSGVPHWDVVVNRVVNGWPTSP